jgi:hypothetical protein
MLTLLPAQSEPRAASLDLPDEVASYKAWPPLLKEPHPVSWDLWVRCMPPTAADWEAARKKTGPHTEHVIMVYGNPAAVAGLSSKGKVLPPGAVIAKEKRHLEEERSPDGVAFMVKREAPEFRETGGWEFMYYPASGAKRATHEQCASCHRSAASRDYIFGEYPRQGGWAPQNNQMQRTAPAKSERRR